MSWYELTSNISRCNVNSNTDGSPPQIVPATRFRPGRRMNGLPPSKKILVGLLVRLSFAGHNWWRRHTRG